MLRYGENPASVGQVLRTGQQTGALESAAGKELELSGETVTPRGQMACDFYSADRIL